MTAHDSGEGSDRSAATEEAGVASAHRYGTEGISVCLHIDKEGQDGTGGGGRDVALYQAKVLSNVGSLRLADDHWMSNRIVNVVRSWMQQSIVNITDLLTQFSLTVELYDTCLASNESAPGGLQVLLDCKMSLS